MDDSLRDAVSRLPLNRSLQDVSEAYVLAVLAASKGNVTSASDSLEIGRATLYRILKRHGMRAGDVRATR